MDYNKLEHLAINGGPQIRYEGDKPVEIVMPEDLASASHWEEITEYHEFSNGLVVVTILYGANLFFKEDIICIEEGQRD